MPILDFFDSINVSRLDDQVEEDPQRYHAGLLMQQAERGTPVQTPTGIGAPAVGYAAPGRGVSGESSN